MSDAVLHLSHWPAMTHDISAAGKRVDSSKTLESDHGEEPVSPGEVSRMGPARSIPEIELLYGRYRRFSFARHFHSITAMGVVETGVMGTCLRGATHRVPAGTVILLNPGDVHAPQSGDGANWSFRMFYLDDALLNDLLHPAGQNRPPSFVKPLAHDAALYSDLSALHRLLESESDPLAAESGLVSLLQSISRYSDWTGPRRYRKAGQSKAERVREYLHAYATRRVTLRTLSDVADLSPWHLLRSFRECYGLTPHAYQTQARIDRGRKLLAAGIPIAETALMTGFTDQSHFTRHFKRFTGVTPGGYSACKQDIRRN